MQNSASQWKALGIAVIVLLAFGMISAKTERIAIVITLIIAGTLFLKKLGETLS